MPRNLEKVWVKVRWASDLLLLAAFLAAVSLLAFVYVSYTDWGSWTCSEFIHESVEWAQMIVRCGILRPVQHFIACLGKMAQGHDLQLQIPVSACACVCSTLHSGCLSSVLGCQHLVWILFLSKLCCLSSCYISRGQRQHVLVDRTSNWELRNLRFWLCWWLCDLGQIM